MLTGEHFVHTSSIYIVVLHVFCTNVSKQTNTHAHSFMRTWTQYHARDGLLSPKRKQAMYERGEKQMQWKDECQEGAPLEELRFAISAILPVVEKSLFCV